MKRKTVLVSCLTIIAAIGGLVTLNAIGTTDKQRTETNARAETADSDMDVPEKIANTERIRIVSYNVENLYDTIDDPNTDDDDFTPNGRNQWDETRYQEKLEHTAKAICAAGQGEDPVLVGLCEVENATVLHDLLTRTKMENCGYSYLHKDSPDHRGIDVALLYQPNQIKILSKDFLHVQLDGDGNTRDILYAQCQLKNGTCLHLLVNHWPSMRGGRAESENKRDAAAEVARHKIDEIRKTDPQALIVLMGDFNSYPTQNCIVHSLGVSNNTDKPQTDGLYNLMYRYADNNGLGTHKFEGKWGVLDQLIVSGPLLNQKSKTFTTPSSAHICHFPFLIEKDRDGNDTPKSTFKGTFYRDGYSDHLPVMLDLYLR